MGKKTEKAAEPPRDEKAAREKCFRLLSLRARSSAELRDRLARDGFPDEVIEEVLSGLEDAGLVDDEDFARSWVAGRQTSGGTGRKRLRWELRRKGISDDLIRSTVDEEIDDSAEEKRAMELVRRRLRGRRPEREDVPRLRRFLLGRGFEVETIDSVLERTVGDEEQS